MSFLTVIKRELYDERKHAGTREKVLVDTRALWELVSQFEVLDATERALHREQRGLEVTEWLRNLIIAAYQQQGKNSEATLMLVMDTLRPLMEERAKELEITRKFTG